MRREFDFFDDDIIEAEFDAIPAKDAAKLNVLMDYYETVGLGDPSPAQVDNYGDGIVRIRHIKSAYQGRALFYVGETGAGYQELWLLTVYKKESQDVPKHILQRAKERKSMHEAKMRTEREKKR